MKVGVFLAVPNKVWEIAIEEGTSQWSDTMVQEPTFSADYTLPFGILVFDSKETAHLLVPRQDVRLRMGMACRETLRTSI